jgi:hypothetical protein
MRPAPTSQMDSATPSGTLSRSQRPVAQAQSLSQPLILVIDRILATGKITTADQTYLLHMTRLGTQPNLAEKIKIDRVFQRLQQGLVRVVD